MIFAQLRYTYLLLVPSSSIFMNSSNGNKGICNYIAGLVYISQMLSNGLLRYRTYKNWQVLFCRLMRSIDGTKIRLSLS